MRERGTWDAAGAGAAGEVVGCVGVAQAGPLKGTPARARVGVVGRAPAAGLHVDGG